MLFESLFEEAYLWGSIPSYEFRELDEAIYSLIFYTIPNYCATFTVIAYNGGDAAMREPITMTITIDGGNDTIPTPDIGTSSGDTNSYELTITCLLLGSMVEVGLESDKFTSTAIEGEVTPTYSLSNYTTTATYAEADETMTINMTFITALTEKTTFSVFAANDDDHNLTTSFTVSI